MKTLRIYPTSINARFIDDATEALNRGDIIIYPTDSYYALGCSALNNGAIERLCKLKGINPLKETLSVVCADISQASEYARIDNVSFATIRRNTPGPFTFLLPASPRLPKVFKGRRTVGIRIPDNAIARALAESLGNPLLSTSITTDGDGEATIDAESVAAQYESVRDVALMIDGGQGLTQGTTVVDLTDSAEPEVIRQGVGQLKL